MREYVARCASLANERRNDDEGTHEHEEVDELFRADASVDVVVEFAPRHDENFALLLVQLLQVFCLLRPCERIYEGRFPKKCTCFIYILSASGGGECHGAEPMVRTRPGLSRGASEPG